MLEVIQDWAAGRIGDHIDPESQGPEIQEAKARLAERVSVLCQRYGIIPASVEDVDQFWREEQQAVEQVMGQLRERYGPAVGCTWFAQRAAYWVEYMGEGDDDDQVTHGCWVEKVRDLSTSTLSFVPTRDEEMLAT